MGLSGKHRKQQSNNSSLAKPKEKHSVHWFRKGLRLHDNPALIYALKNATTFRCVFVIDPWFAGSVELNLTKHSSNVGINKWRFLLQCLEDLDQSLRKLNSRLFVIRGQPADVLPKLFKEWGTNCLTFEKDPEPYGKVRDAHLTEICKELNIEVISAVSHTLYKLEKIIEKNGGRAPLTYHQFQGIIAELPGPPKPEPCITMTTVGNAYTPMTDNDENDKFGVPNLEELGFDTSGPGIKQPVWVGGETEALVRLNRHLERKAWVASFGRPKMTPQSLLASQTGLSPYLRFGCLSTRLFYYQLTDLYKKIKKTVPPLSLHGQLLWREFFYCAATMNPNFDKISGNPICVQINWDSNELALSKWANGQTGFPWIDSIMVQLREEGWIHHLARHAVACFLTRGDLWLSWESGMKVFEELLLDADWSVNAGMWMWLSCSSFFQQFFHCYCPIKFGRKADPNGDFIRRYLPVLKNYPNRFIHEPWNAPENVQKAAKCIIGRDYPLQMVNHAEASRTNMERMKQVYQQLSKFRATELRPDTGGSALQSLLFSAKMQASAAISNSSPSPTTILSLANNSGNYLCKMSQNAPNQQLTFHQTAQPSLGCQHGDLPPPPPQPMKSSLNTRMYTLQNHSAQVQNGTSENTGSHRPLHEFDEPRPYKPRIMHWNTTPNSPIEVPNNSKMPQFSYEYNKYQMDSASSEKFHFQHQQQQPPECQQNYEVFCKTETGDDNVEMIDKDRPEDVTNVGPREEQQQQLEREAVRNARNCEEKSKQQEIEQENTLNMEMNTICNIGDTG